MLRRCKTGAAIAAGNGCNFSLKLGMGFSYGAFGNWLTNRSHKLELRRPRDLRTCSCIARAMGDTSKHLERKRDALPSADTQRHDAALETVAPHRVQ